MKSYEEYISGLKLPVYILIKNLRFEHDFDIDAPIARGEIIRSGATYQELLNTLPKPEFPVDDYKLSLLDSKYGNIAQDELEFDDSVFDIAEGDPSDFDIFSESYTIVFICPADEEFIVRFLLNEYNREHDLVNIWINCLDRIHIYPFFSLEVTSETLIDNLADKFKSGVKLLPQPPSAEEWEELKDYL